MTAHVPWTQFSDAPEEASAPGGYLAAGHTNTYSGYCNDGWVLRLDEDGKEGWCLSAAPDDRRT